MIQPNKEMNLTDNQQGYYNSLPNEEQKAAFLQMLQDSHRLLNTTITDLSGERECIPDNDIDFERPLVVRVTWEKKRVASSSPSQKVFRQEIQIC